MKIKKILILASITAIVAIGGIYGIGRSILPDLIGIDPTGEVTDGSGKDGAGGGGTALIGKRLPVFDLPLALGGRLRSSDLVGTPAVIVFWATWNSASADQVKILDDYLANNPEQSRLIHVVAVDSQEDPSVTSSFVRRGGYVVPIPLDAYGTISTAYGVKSLPIAYFVTREGVVQSLYTGVMSERVLVEKVDSLLKHKVL